MRIHKLTLLSLGTVMAGAAAAQNGSIAVTLDGTSVHFNDTRPKEIHGIPMVPIRRVIEANGGTVDWDPFGRSVTVSGNSQVFLKIGSRMATVDGIERELEQAPVLVGERTMVPMSLLEPALGATALYDPENHWISFSTALAAAGTSSTMQADDTPYDRAHGPVVSETEAAPPAIARVQVESDTWLCPGKAVTISLDGEPDMSATAQIDGYADEITLKETEPGHYEATWTVPSREGVYVPDAAVTCTLRDPQRDTEAAQEATSRIAIDTGAPTISSIFPAPEQWLPSETVAVSAELYDGGSGVDGNSISLVVNGVDRSHEAYFENGKVVWQPRPEDVQGKMDVHLTVSDIAGNATTYDWSFQSEASETSRAAKADEDAFVWSEPMEPNPAPAWHGPGTEESVDPWQRPN